MRFVLILMAALTVCAQAAPQFHNFNSQSKDWESEDVLLQDQPQTSNENHQPFPSQSKFRRHHHPNHYGRETHQNDRGSSNQCWDPVYHTYRDSSNSQQTSQYPSQYRNDNYNPSIHPHHYPRGHWGGPQAPPGPPPPHQHGPPQHHYGHGPPPHHHGHGPPPHHHGHGPPPHHHGHGPPSHHHGHGPPSHHHHHGHGPPSHDHGHGPPSHDHGHGPPPYHHEQRPPPLPPRPTHHPENGNTNYELELCEDTSKENVVSEKLESSTVDDSVDVIISSSSPIPNTSVQPRDPEVVTQSTVDSSIRVTTEFDWNNYYIDGASADNTGGSGIIDIRTGGVPAV